MSAPNAVSPIANSIRGLKSHVKELTGHEPPTCPWRAYYDPLVGETLKRAKRTRDMGAAAWEADPPAILLDAYDVYTGARDATQAYDDDERRKRLEAERRAKQKTQR